MRSSAGVPGDRRPAGAKLSRGLAAVSRVLAAPGVPGLRCAGSGRRGGSGGEV